MKAMVLAAGIGSRLKEFTAQTPKCLVPLGDGTTMLDRVVESLIRSGVTEIIINLFHCAEQIEQHVEDKNYYGIHIEYSREETLLGTGGGLKQAAWFFDGNDPFFVHNADVFSDVDLAKLMAEHRALAAIGTLGVMNRKTDRPLLFSDSLQMVGLQGGAGALHLGFSGLQVLSPAIFRYMESFENPFSTISVFMKAVEAGERIIGFDMTGSYWIDMGTPEKLLELKKYLQDQK